MKHPISLCGRDAHVQYNARVQSLVEDTKINFSLEDMQLVYLVDYIDIIERRIAQSKLLLHDSFSWVKQIKLMAEFSQVLLGWNIIICAVHLHPP